MVSLADSLVSSSARKMPIRKRPDLTAQRQRYLGQSYWVVKEPVGLNYFRFQDEEYAILQMLDGRTSLDEIKERFEAEFPPQKITLEELQQFLGMLHRSGLVITAAPGQGHQLRKRRDERRRKELTAAATNILCIRFKGFDPDRVLNWLYPLVWWFFTPLVMAFCLTMALSAATLVTVEFDVFRSKLPGFQDFFSLNNAFLLAITLGVTKVLHEFGHGLTCKHFGGECHEMGVMILVLTPCLYCNVSDSWMLPSKWRRAAIGAAGIYVEVVLASACTFIWWFTEPGFLHYLSLNVMFISSVSTILFNANPLLRYDGYYILADVAEIPNLRQKATSIFSRKMGLWFLGIEPPEDPFLPERNQIFFALYTVAAALYRWVVVLSILWFLYKVFEPYGLQVVGQLITGMALYGLLFQPLYKLVKFFYIPGRLEKVKKPRMYLSLCGLGLIVAGVVFIPLPHHVMCTLEIQPRDAVAVYVDTESTLEAIHVKPGQTVVGPSYDDQGKLVTEGTPLADMSNVELELAVASLEGDLEEIETRLEGLQRQRFRNPDVVDQIPAAEKTRDMLENQLAQRKEERERLRLTAPAGGAILPPPEMSQRQQSEDSLSTWSGTPLMPRNVGATLPEGTLFCQVGDPAKYEAILVIDQGDIEFIREVSEGELGQDVEIKLDELPHDVLLGRIDLVARVDLKISSNRLSTKSGGELATTTDPTTGAERPMSTSYQARVPLDDVDPPLCLGLRGQAKIHTAPQTLWQRIWRLLVHTFNFRL